MIYTLYKQLHNRQWICADYNESVNAAWLTVGILEDINLGLYPVRQL